MGLTFDLEPWVDQASRAGNPGELPLSQGEHGPYLFVAAPPAICRDLRAGSGIHDLVSEDRLLTLRTSFADLVVGTDWGRAPGREGVVALELSAEGFGSLIRQGAPARFDAGMYQSKNSWRLATRYAQVLLAWELEPVPVGTPWRHCLRLGLRAGAIQWFAGQVRGVGDLTALVAEQRELGAERRTVPATRAFHVPPDLLRQVFSGRS